MKKTIILAGMTLLMISTTQAQSSTKINGLDSTVATVKDVTKDYVYQTPYCVVTDLSIGQNRYFAPTPMNQSNLGDSISVSASIVLYADQSAYTSGLQPLTVVPVSVRFANGSVLPTHWAIKQKLYAAIPKQ